MKHLAKTLITLVIVISLGMLAHICPANAAVTLDISVPDQVTWGAQFTVSVTVNNDSTTDTVTFDKVAALYVLGDLKFKGPYQVATGLRTVGPGSSTTFTFPFSIRYTRGCIVPVVVTLFKTKYDYNNAVGLNAIGVNVQ
jgi:hypothetical protein